MKDTASTKQRFEVWVEGFSATGEHGTAQKVGEVWADSFIEACVLLAKDRLDTERDGSLRLWDGHPTIWGCRLFDNEAEARESNG